MNEKMNQKKRDLLLFELESSVYWEAINDLAQEKISQAWSAIGILDPFKEPTVMARSQGMLIGFHFLKNEIERIKEEQEKQGEIKETLKT